MASVCNSRVISGVHIYHLQICKANHQVTHTKNQKNINFTTSIAEGITLSSYYTRWAKKRIVFRSL